MRTRRLRGAYQGKVPDEQVANDVRRLSKPGALTAALNWYRALDTGTQIGMVAVPSLYVWGDKDMALGETAALGTERYVTGPYRFERLHGCSHWLREEVSETTTALSLNHVRVHADPSDSRS